MRSAINLILFLAFLGVFGAYVYKTSFAPTIVTADANSVSIEESVDTDGNRLVTKQDIENIVKEYLLNNPEIIVTVAEKLQKKKLAETNKKANDFLKQNMSTIAKQGEPPFLGDLNGDVVVVLFYDYNCTYCKQAHAQILEVLKKDSKAKFVLRPIPILGGTSMYAAKVSLALNKISPDKFALLHDQMMQMKPVTEESVRMMVEKNGLDYAIVENEINSFSIKTLINKNFELAKNLGVKGAPSQVINGNFVPGMIDAEKYHSAFKEIRKAASEKPEAQPSE